MNPPLESNNYKMEILQGSPKKYIEQIDSRSFVFSDRKESEFDDQREIFDMQDIQSETKQLKFTSKNPGYIRRRFIYR